ncbi:MAG: class I SAM-dependent methyltransferase [Synergistaceae bacterium]|jgi:SAM-dependent methyltransferase|nr:class I SAM-dependent methyltransferase [Synergistaceae bacterium]
MNDYDYSVYYRFWHDDTAEHQTQMISYCKSFLSPLLKDTPPSTPILDVGCGTGFALLALKHMGFANLHGIERDAAQYESSLSKGLQVTLTDNTEGYLGGFPQTYDVVLLLDVLEHIPVEKQIGFLRAIYSALRPDGKLILQVPNACSPFGLYFRYNDYTHHSSFTSHSLQFVCVNAGFNSFAIQNIGKDLPEPSWRGLVYWGLTYWSSDSRKNLRHYLHHRKSRLFRSWWKRNFMWEFGYSPQQMEQYAFVFTPNILAVAQKGASSE